MAQSNFSGDIEDDSPEVWAKRLKENKDYRSLAAVFNSGYPSDQQKLAESILVEAGSEAVDAILVELTRESVGSYELAKLLVRIGDFKAVPIIKRMLDRGAFDAYGARGD